MKFLIQVIIASLIFIACDDAPASPKQMHHKPLSKVENNHIIYNPVNDVISKIKIQLLRHRQLRNQKIVLFIDYALPITKERFFVYNTRKQRIIYSAFVGHAGRSGAHIPYKFSNTHHTRKTSLGLYKIGKTYKGRFGKSRKVYGLSKANSNAYKRAIVIHSMAGYLPQNLYSWGCFTFFKHDYETVLKYAKNGRYMIVSAE
jgi:hypothetical protein